MKKMLPLASIRNSNVPALVYCTSRAASTTVFPSLRRTFSDSAIDGASSISFWWRRWIEHSRSPRWTTLPWWSPRIWNSMWRGASMYFSM